MPTSAQPGRSGSARCARLPSSDSNAVATPAPSATDVPVEVLAAFLSLVLDGLVLHLGTGMAVADAAAVLDLAEEAVRRPNVHARSPMDEDSHATSSAQEAVS